MATKLTLKYGISTDSPSWEQKCQKRALGSFTTETIRSLDEFKAAFQKDSFMPAVLTKDALFVKIAES